MNSKGTHRIVYLLSYSILVCCLVGTAAESPQPAGSSPGKDAQDTSAVHSYTVNKKVSDFAATRDLSTPEAAYATIMRDFMATGASGSEWSEISVLRMGGTERRPIPPQRAASYRAAEVQEVVVYRDRLALVLSKVSEGNKVSYDQRYLFQVNGRWLNAGQDGPVAKTQAARDTFERKRERMYRLLLQDVGEYWNRPPVADPNAYLKPYVDFLREQGREPHAFLLDAFKKYRLVVMGEVHNRPAYWAFNAELVRDPAFARAVGTIYTELPSNHQEGIDTFLTQDTCEKERVIRMLRDFFELGWPCQPTLDFLVAVWEVNQKLSPGQKLRIRLVDMQRPWEKIQKRADWGAYNVDRDSFMAKNVLDDLEAKKDPRHGFFIVGMGHAMENLHIDEQTPSPSAGCHLRKALGDQLYTVFQHAPVMTNQGETSGRLALGLIDTAFARLDGRPIAFPLTEGPFGKLPFDGMPDAYVYGTFADGYDAYLYLVPLEKEVFSPLIEGFYTPDFMPEVDRRYQLMTGHSLFPDGGVPKAERVIAMRAAYWGQPRDWIPDLGPKNAWQEGDHWREKFAAMAPQRQRDATRGELTKELDKIYRAIKMLDPEKHFWTSWERTFDFNYLTMTDWPAMFEWWCAVTRDHPLESVTYGELTRDKEGLPQIEATTTLKGGVRFSKVFRFVYLPTQQCWQAQYGLDLHLDPQWKDLPKAKKEMSQ
jgi:hypothetical protein